MLAFRRVLVTALLAWIFVVGPLLAVAAGMALLTSMSPTLIKRLEKVGKEEANTANAVTPLKDREPTGIRQQFDFLAETLAILKPVPALVPTGEDALTFAHDAILWQFDGNVCKRVVAASRASYGTVIAECDSGERFLLIATAVTGRRSVLRCAALPLELAGAAPGCR